MRLGWYGDDFTGATDTLATAALAQWRSLLFLGVPTPRRMSQEGELAAIGIAGSARTMAPPEIERELVPVGAVFPRVGGSVLLSNCCSTFDISPRFGRVGQALRSS